MEGGSWKVIVGATMVMAVSLAMVVALVFVLLAELYCSLFPRRRSLPAAAAGITTGGDDTSASRLGVIAAPRNLLFPPVAGKQSGAETETVGGVAGAPTAAGHLVYISNPVFDAGVDDTPFETPATSPSRLESGSSSGEEDKYPMTPPLTPMKKLPLRACSVSLGDSASSKMGVSSSSSSTSPSISPSW